MQIYPTFKPNQYRFTNKMLNMMPKSFKIAFIDFEKKGEDAQQDGIHDKQEYRYYSCLIDKDCPCIPKDGTDEIYLRRTPKLSIELPGFPILGDGKGDNQNHAVPFSRGSIIQCVDANQGAYFEQMLLLPCVLGEFRKNTTRRNQRNPTYNEMGLARKIVGFPEHITSDIGSIGEMAAGAETAFGTTLQRSYAVLGSRMHYGHPDMMNKTFMIQQGGVSKATKTVNLSEDIFAGMDFTLRGDGRTIHHAEYFHVSKGRDLGFGTVLTFFAKLSSGTGEQVLTRQMLRLGHILGLGEFLGFYYAHAGYYIGQHFLSKCVPLFTAMWLLVTLDDPEGDFKRYVGSTDSSGASVMSAMLATCFSWILAFFIFIMVCPLWLEAWFQQGVVRATWRVFMQMFTLAPLHFIFQAKIIGIYVTSELVYGGAGYLATGRGLPTDRRPFIKAGGGTYQDWAQNAFYDGFRLMCCWWMAAYFGGIIIVKDGVKIADGMVGWSVAAQLTIMSWLYAPFLFNPYQFDYRYFKKDLDDWTKFFFQGETPWKVLKGQEAKVYDGATLVKTIKEGGIIYGAWDRGNLIKLSDGSGNAKTIIDGRKILEEQAEMNAWKEWHNDTQMLPVGSKGWRSIRASLPAILAWAIPIGLWYTVVNSKMYLLSSFSEFSMLNSIFALMPPVFLSLIFCFAISAILERLKHAPSFARKGCLKVLLTTSLSKDGSLDGRELRLPWYSLLVILLDCGEAYASFRLVLTVKWTNTFAAGMVLKYLLLSFVLLCADCFVRLKSDLPDTNAFKTIQNWLQRHLKTWLRAHRMAFDLIVSAFLFWTMAPFAAFDYLRSQLFPGYSIHNLIIYRQGGHLDRSEEQQQPFRCCRRCCSGSAAQQRGSMTGLSLSHGDDTTQSFQSELEESAGDVLLESYQDTLDADNVFSLLDKNNDGKVTRRELIAALFDNDEIRRQLQLGTYSEVEKFVDEADNDGDDAINRQEFARVLVARGLSKRG